MAWTELYFGSPYFLPEACMEWPGICFNRSDCSKLGAGNFAIPAVLTETGVRRFSGHSSAGTTF
jgi:hypothetical protein